MKITAILTIVTNMIGFTSVLTPVRLPRITVPPYLLKTYGFCTKIIENGPISYSGKLWRSHLDTCCNHGSENGPAKIGLSLVGSLFAFFWKSAFFKLFF